MIHKKFLKVLNGQSFKDIQIRKSGQGVVTVGHTATINIIDKKLVIISDGKEIVREDPKNMNIYFHEGWGGIDLEIIGDEERTTYVLHHVIHIKYPKVRF